MIQYDENLQDQLDDLPLDEDEQNDGPIEPDELDQLISDALPVDEDDDDEGDDGEGEADGSDEESDGDSDAENTPPAQSNKKKGRSAARRAKEAIKRQQLTSELEKTRQEAQQARALAEQERSRAYGMEALIKTISGGASMDEILALATNSGAQTSQQQTQNTQEAPLTARQLEEWYRNKAALNSEMTGLQSTWLPIHQRVAKTAPQVTSWFDRDFTAGIEANPQRRDLLKAVADFSYPMEALYAASRKEGFERLSTGEQISLVYRCSSKIAERNKPEPTRQKREALKTPSSSSVNSRLPADKVSNEDWFNRMYPIPK